MEAPVEFLVSHWLAILVTALGLSLAALLLLKRRRQPEWSIPLLLWSSCLVLVGIGGLGAIPGEWALWIAGGSAVILFGMLAVVVITGQWWPPLAYVSGAIFLLGIGGLGAEKATHALNEVGKSIISLRPNQPWWLVLLVLVPLIIALSFRSLTGLGPTRRWLAITLRCLLILFLVLALADTQARETNEDLTVLFLWDRSLSIPQEWSIPQFKTEASKDLREERLKTFINEAVAKRGPARAGDRAGVIVFGRYPRLELPPSSVPELRLKKIASPVDETYTDIAAAIKLALASFPEGTGKRIVLISDGNQNMGNAEEQARIAKQNGVQIDVVPIAAGRTNQNEVLVERIEAPALTEKGSRLLIRVILRSHNPNVVVGNLRLVKTSLEMLKEKLESETVMEQVVRLPMGLTPVPFSLPGSDKEDTFIYEARFIPIRVEYQDGRKPTDGLPGDRIENNRASTNVMARGQRAVLIVEPEVGAHQLLAERLRLKSGLSVVTVQPKQLPTDPTQLALVLSRFDSVILANIPADELTEEQQKVIHSNTHDQGCGLVMIGGPQSFGAGGWQGTEVEKALPVTSDLKSMKVEGKSGLVLMMHASEMAEGNAWQKKIAKLAIEKLSPVDMVGMLYYAWEGGPANGHTWHIKFQQIANNRPALLRKVDTMNPGDMPDVDPALEKAYKELANPAYGLGTKHIIFISDGDHWDAGRAVVAKLNRAKISCTTVCITTHGQAEVVKMARLAKQISGPKGRSYHIKDPSELPAIYIKESRLVSQSFVHDKPFRPLVLDTSGPMVGIQNTPDLFGFVRTTRRNSPLVEVPIETPKIGEGKFPILAYWYYGLGKSVAFTSDARTVPGKTFWDRDWANDPGGMYTKFWEQTVDWSLRAVETGKNLVMTTELRDGKVKVIIDARKGGKKPLTEVELKGGITSPGLKPGDPRRPALKFEQKNSGIYEAEFKADDIGSYFINVQAKWKENGKAMSDSVRGGVTIPYSPEFAEMESNVALLDRLRDITGGKTFPEEDLGQVATAGDVFRQLPAELHSQKPIWHWLAVLAGICLFFDVAVRRIAIEPEKVKIAMTNWWYYLRGRAPIAAEATPFLERLQSRKAQVGEGLDKGKAARRFEGEDTPVVAPSGAEASPMPSPAARSKPSAVPKVGPEKEKEAADYASRLLAAKKRAMEEREKKKES
jgi:uncharacterized membrane protein